MPAAEQFELLIDAALPGETRAALTANGRLQEFALERRDRPSRIGEIYLARISRHAPGIGYFLDLGLDRPGVWSAPPKGPRPAQGAAVLVQVTADAFDGKGPKVTADIALGGPNLVLRAGAKEATRRNPDVAVERTVLDAEAANLEKAWAGIAAAAKTAGAPARLHGFDDPVNRLLAWFAPLKPVLCAIDGADAYARARGFCRETCPELGAVLEPHRAPQSLFESRDIEAAVEGLSLRRVELANGVTILIDEMEALTAIDIDAGGLVAHERGADAALHANLTALPEALRQIRLRNIGGLALIDAVRMAKAAQRKKVLDLLRVEAAKDRAPVHLHGYTASGLIEITRERGRAPLSDLLLGEWTDDRHSRAKRPETTAFDALRAARRLAGQGAKRGKIECRVAPPVAAFLHQRGRDDKAAWESVTGHSLEIAEDAALAIDRFELRQAT